MNETTQTPEPTQTKRAAQQSSSRPRPPRGPRLRMLVLMLVLLAGGAGLGAAFHEPLDRGFDAMRAAVGGERESAAVAGEVQYYTCGMHPWVIEP
ncbi:MAG: hypothetical protein ACODAQ_08650, partial [Phycisphaeraceae bacterium]